MNNFKYFSDTSNGTKEFLSADRRKDGLYGFDGYSWIKITRKVVMKSRPSKHECDDRCMSATGRTMQCECACGGKNHGRQAFVCVAA